MADLFDLRFGAVLGSFAGDTLGVPFEGAKSPLSLDSLDQISRFSAYSDDTEMAIAVLEELVEMGEVERDSMAEHFAHVATIPGGGYGTKTSKVLLAIRDGSSRTDALAVYYPDGGSQRNGAAMRVAPLAAHLYDDPEELRRQVTECTLATHTGEEAIDCANVQAAAIAAAIRGDDILAAALDAALLPASQEAFERVRTALEENWGAAEAAAQLGTAIVALRSVPGALYAALRSESFEEAVLFAINMGGDTDTQAAMAGAIVGGRDGAASIPDAITERLDDGPRGVGYVRSLCQEMWEKEA